MRKIFVPIVVFLAATSFSLAQNRSTSVQSVPDAQLPIAEGSTECGQYPTFLMGFPSGKVLVCKDDGAGKKVWLPSGIRRCDASPDGLSCVGSDNCIFNDTNQGPLLYSCFNGSMTKVGGSDFSKGGEITGDLMVDGTVTVRGNIVGAVDLSVDPSYPSERGRVEAVQSGIQASVSTNGYVSGGYTKWGSHDLETGSVNPTGKAIVRSENAVQIEGLSLIPGTFYHPGTTLGTTDYPWSMAFLSSIDINADGTAELTTGGTNGPSVILGDPNGSGPAFTLWNTLGGHAVVNVPLWANNGIDLTGDGTPDLTSDGSGNALFNGSASKFNGQSASYYAAASSLSNYVLSSSKGVANGVASLDSDGKVPTAQIPQSLVGVTSDGTTFDVSAANGEWLKFTTQYGILTPRVLKQTDLGQSDGSNCWSYLDIYPKYANGTRNGSLMLSFYPATGTPGSPCGRAWGYGTDSIVGSKNSVTGGADSYFWRQIGLQNGVFSSASTVAPWAGGFNYSALFAANPAANTDWNTLNGGFPVYASIFSSWNGSSSGGYWSSRRKFMEIFADSMGAGQRIQAAINFEASPELYATYYRDSMFTFDLQTGTDQTTKSVWDLTPYKLRSVLYSDVSFESEKSVSIKADYDGGDTASTVNLVVGGGQSYTFAAPASACASGMEMSVNSSGQVVCKTRSPMVILPPLGSCDNGGNYTRGAWSSTGAAAVGCEDVRGFYKHPYFSYPDGSYNVMAYTFIAPANWDGTLTVSLWWSGSQTTGAVHWFEAHDCIGAGSTFYNQPTTTATVDSTAASTAYKQTVVTLSVTGLSSCAGNITTVLVGRDGTHANDTYTADAQVNGIKLALGAM